MSDELVAVAAMESSEEAAMLAEMLENAGIPTVVSGAMDPFYGRLSALGAKVLVRPEDLERAQEMYVAFFESIVPEADEEPEPDTDPAKAETP